jgi:hypothetical protein
MKSTVNDRQSRGAQALGALVSYWLSRSGLSHEQLAQVMDWGLGERCNLHGAPLSRIRNGMQPRGAGLQHLDAMAQGNAAIWTWQVEGEQIAIQQFGPFSGWGVKAEQLNQAVWLPRADDEREPLDLGDLAMVVAGRMELPYIHAGIASPAQAQQMGSALLALMEQLAMDHQWTPAAALRHLLQAYPATDTARRHRLKGLIMGDLMLTADELEGEIAALAEMVRAVRGLPVFTPADLREELLSSAARPAS